MKVREMFRTQKAENGNGMEIVFVDLEKAEDILTVRFFPIDNPKSHTPDLQINFGLVNVPAPSLNMADPDPAKWNPYEVACAIRDAVDKILKLAWEDL